MGYKQFGYFCSMKLLQGVLDFYIDASVHVALAIFSLVSVTCLTLNIPYNDHFSLFLFFGSISCYNFIKYGVEAEKYILVANRYHKGIQFFSLLSLLIALYHAYFLNFETYFGIAILVLFTGLYALPLLPKAKNLRSWGGLKIFVVALVWAGATVTLPVLAAQDPFSWDVWIETIQRFLLVLALLVPFEVRDLAYDDLEMKTLPQRFGVAITKFFGAFTVVLFFFFTFLKDDTSPSEIISKGILFLILGVLILLTKRHQTRYFASFWVEAVPIIWWGLCLFTGVYY